MEISIFLTMLFPLLFFKPSEFLNVESNEKRHVE
jgi:hypothetical protein